MFLALSIYESFGNKNINYKQRKTEWWGGVVFFINIACVPDNDLLWY